MQNTVPFSIHQNLVTPPVLISSAATLTHCPCLHHFGPGLFQEAPSWLTIPGTPALIIFLNQQPAPRIILLKVRSCHSLALEWVPVSFTVKAKVLIAAYKAQSDFAFLPDPTSPLTLSSLFSSAILAPCYEYAMML